MQLTKHQSNRDSHFSDYHDIDTNILSQYIKLSLLSSSTNTQTHTNVCAQLQLHSMNVPTMDHLRIMTSYDVTKCMTCAHT